MSLTPRERQMLAMRARGVTMYGVAVELGVSEMTVKHTMHRIYRKLGVDGLQAALVAIGWTQVPDDDAAAERRFLRPLNPDPVTRMARELKR